MEINFGEVCRTCLKKPTDFKNINEPTKNAVTLAEMIKYCTSIPVDDGDLLPTNLCIDCVKEAEIAYKFKTQTEKVNDTLRKYLQEQIESFQQTVVRPDELHKKNSNTSEVCIVENQPSNSDDFMVIEESDEDEDADEEINNEEFKAELEKFSGDFIEYKVRLGDDDTDDDDDVDKEPVEILPSKVIEQKLYQQKNKKSNKKKFTLHGKKNFKCPVCPKRFKDRKSCVEHYRVHTGERPYECKECGAKFHRTQSYNHHIKYTHVQETPHKCPLCHRGFKTYTYLKKHLKSCNGHGCKNCLFVFSSEEALRQHQSFGCEPRTDEPTENMNVEVVN